MARLRQQRSQIEADREKLLEAYRAKQAKDRADSIENTFFREWGLVERMGELQNCLVQTGYTGEGDEDALYTQLLNMERMLDKLREKQPERQGSTELFIPGWHAMEIAGECAQRQCSRPTSAARRETALRNYCDAMKKVTSAIEELSEAFRPQADEAYLVAERVRRAHWEQELVDIVQRFPERVDDMSAPTLRETAQDLAEYAAQRFADRL